MTKLYDHEFSPCRIDGDRRVVASETEWTSVRAYCSGLKRAGQTARIRVPVDVFGEAGKAKVYDRDGRQLFISSHGGWSAEETGNPWVLTCDVVSRLLALIDDYPSVTWLLETERPENVAAMWPSADIFEGETGDDKPAFWPNLWLYARADTQAEADARIPHLLQVPAAVRGLVMEPREDVELCNVSGWKDKAYWWGRTIMGGTGINHVIIRGGDEPMHPDHVRSIIRQCETAGVPVWCESPVGGRTWNQLPEGER